MFSAGIVLTALTLVLFLIYLNNNEKIVKSMAITLLTASYHFDTRLIFGYIIPLFKHKINPNSKYFKVKPLELKFYNFINVKKWKNNAPTFNEDEFNIKIQSPKSLLINVCNSEIVHTVNLFLSFVPLIFSVWFGSFWVFFITSVIAFFIDLQFVIIQRYNRNRLVKVLQKQSTKTN